MKSFFDALKKRVVAVLALSLLLQGFPFVPSPVVASTESSYRWRNDDGTESTATYAAAENAPITGVEKLTTKRVRFGVEGDSYNELREESSIRLRVPEAGVASMLIDTSTGYGYAATGSDPAKIIKYSLGAGASAPTRVGELILNDGDFDVPAGVIDTVNGYAYFVTNTQNGVPARVIKVALGSGSAAPTYVGTTTLDTNDTNVNCGTIDAANGYAYFAGTGSSGRIVIKVALGSGASLPYRVGSVDITSSEISGCTIDTANGRAYFVSENSPARVHQVLLGAGDTAPSLVNTFTSSTGTIGRSIAIDTTNEYIYVGTDTNIVKAQVNNITHTLTYVGAATLGGGQANPLTAAIDIPHGYVYFGVNTDPSKLLKVSFNGASAPTIVGTLTFATDEGRSYPYSDNPITIDPTAGYAYLGGDSISGSVGYVKKVNLGVAAALPTAVATLSFDSVADDAVHSSVIDTTNGYAYLASANYVGSDTITKIRLSDHVIVGRVDLTGTVGSVGNLYSAVIDPSNGFAYFGASQNKIVKIALGSGDAAPSWVATLSTNAGEDRLYSAVIDTVNNFAYFGTDNSGASAVVVKIDTDPGNTFARIGALAIGEGYPDGGAIDVTGGFAYFVTETNPTRVKKIDLSTFTIASTLTLDVGEPWGKATVIDTTNGHLYVTTYDTPSMLVKIRLSDFTRLGVLDTGSTDDFYSAEIDVADGHLYAGTTFGGRVHKFALGSGDALPTVVADIFLQDDEHFLATSMIDTASGYLYFGTAGTFMLTTGRMARIQLHPTDSFRLEYGQKSSTCAAIVNWTQVAASPTTQHWAMAASTNIANADPTTDDAGITNVNPTFEAGAIHDTTSQTAAVALRNDKFTEIEYSIKATNNADDDGDYCFRLTDAGSRATDNVGATIFTRSEYAEASLGVRPYIQGYRWRNDDGSESTATNNAAENARLIATLGATKRLRFSVSANDASGSSAKQYRLEYGVKDDACESVAGWTQVPTTATTEDWEMSDSANLTNGEATTDNAGVGNHDGTFTAGAAHDTTSQTAGITLNGAAVTELEYSVEATANAVLGRQYCFRLTDAGQTLSATPEPVVESLGYVTADPGENNPYGAAIDTEDGFAYFVTNTSPITVLKVSLSTNGIVDRLTLPGGDGGGSWNTTAIDSSGGTHYLYLANADTPTTLVKIDLDTFTRVTSVTFGAGIGNAASIVIDTANGFAYVGTRASPYKVVKVDVGAMSVVTDLAIPNQVAGAVLDTATGFAYFAKDGSGTCAVTKINTAPASFALVGTLALAESDCYFESAVIDTTGATDYAYFGDFSDPGRVAKIDLATFTETGMLTLNSNEQAGWMVIDEANGKIYVTNDRSTPLLVTVDIDTFARESVLTLSSSYPYYMVLDDSTSSKELLIVGDKGPTTVEAVSLGDATLVGYAEASFGTNDPTQSNAITLTRLKTNSTATAYVRFALQNTLSGVLTVTFPAGFTVTGAPTGPASSGCLGSFGFTASTMYATKTNCSGAIVLGGGTVTNPAVAGPYEITWVNDDPGSGLVYITDNDQETVSAAILPRLTFNVGAQNAATDCDGTFVGNGGTVDLGVGDPDAVASSDVSSVKHICTRMTTNASGGALVTVRNANGASGLVSTSTPADAVESATGTVTAGGTERYGICVGSGVADTGKDGVSGAFSPVRVSPFDGSCSTSAHVVGGLTTSNQTIWSLAGPSQNAFARIYVKAAINELTPPHSDYLDTLTFLATATF